MDGYHIRPLFHHYHCQVDQYLHQVGNYQYHSLFDIEEETVQRLPFIILELFHELKNQWSQLSSPLLFPMDKLSKQWSSRETPSIFRVEKLVAISKIVKVESPKNVAYSETTSLLSDFLEEKLKKE